MKKHFFRAATQILSVILLILFLIISIAACSNNSSAGTNGGAAADTDGGNAADNASNTVTTIPDDLPNADLGGFTFRILVFENKEGNQISEIYVAEMTGNVIDDAVYNKIMSVEERFNVDITLSSGSITTPGDTGDQNGIIKRLVLSGDDEFEIVTAHDISMGNMSLEGYFMNMYDIPHLNFDKPWWSKSLIDSLSVGEQMYIMSNFIHYWGLACTRVMYFNKSMFTDLNQDMPYAYVTDHVWTLDKLYSLTKDVYQDLNGNGEKDENDRYGFINPPYYYCFLEPFNLEPYKKDPEGRLYYDLDVNKFSVIAEKFYNILFGPSGFKAKDGPDSEKIFTDGNAMFAYAAFNTAVTKYSFTDVIYGILPMPKLDENQAEYYAGCTDRPLAVPITVNPDNVDNIGIVIEALSAEGYKQVFPVYFELALKVRYADQTEDAEMIDIINKNIILSLNYTYGNYESPYLKLFETLFNAKTPSYDVASYAAKVEKSQIARCEQIMAKFEELSGK